MRRIDLPSSVVFVTSFAVIFATGFFLLLAPVIQGVGSDLAKLDAYRREKPLVEFVKSDAAAQGSAIETQLNLANVMLPNDPFLEAFAVQIEALAKQSNTTITSLTLSAAAQSTATATTATTAASSLPAGVQRSAMNLSLSGQYSAIQSFVAGAAQLLRIAVIEDISMSSGNPGSTPTSTGSTQAVGSDPVLSTQITLATYSLPYAK